MDNEELTIFAYDNYRAFLKDFYESKRKTAEKISFRQFARLAGFNSPSFLKMVIDGKRNLSHESIGKVASALRFNREETEFFNHLVLFNQAEGVEQKKYFAEQILKSRHFRKRHPLKRVQYEYYAHWYYVPVRELVGTDSFEEDPEWIARALVPAITAAEARNAIEALLELGMIRKNAKGKLEQADRAITTGDEVGSASVSQFHREMIHKGAEAIDRFAPSQREVSSLTFGATPETAGKIKELVQRFRKEVIALLMAEEEATEVYQVNFQVFPLSSTGKKE